MPRLLSSTPLMPCEDLDRALAFYEAIGFAVTWRQHDPYAYGAVAQDGVELHFHEPKQRDTLTHGACLVMVDGLPEVHRAFVEGLRRAFGRIPLMGTPRIMRLSEAQSRFTVVDPDGNRVTYISMAESEDAPDYEAWDEAVDRSPLQQALDQAYNLRVFQQFDEPVIARALDAALRKYPDGSAADRARVLAARAEVALAMDDRDLARRLREEIDALSLSSTDREALRAELEAPEALTRLLDGE